MLYSKEKSFLFIHIPKTAGTSIRSVLSPYGGRQGLLNYLGRRLEKYTHFCHATGLTARRTFDPHISYMQVEKILPETELQKLFVFCFCRNPFDRAYSFYLHVLAHPENKKHELIKSYGTFSGMLENLEEVQEPSQVWYMKNEKGEIRADFIGRFEAVEADFKHVCQELKIPFSLPVKNSREHKAFPAAYSATNWKYVADYYAEDFQKLGYNNSLFNG